MVTAALKLVYAFKNEKVGAFTFTIIIELKSTYAIQSLKITLEQTNHYFQV